MLKWNFRQPKQERGIAKRKAALRKMSEEEKKVPIESNKMERTKNLSK